MRVTAGKYKGRSIAAPPGKTTRPALERVRLALFDLLRPWVDGGAVLDLFAGSGAFLVEAASRGAREVHGVDLDRHAVAAARGNARAIGIAEPFTVERADALEAIARLSGAGRRFDVIFCAPPYWQDLQPRALALCDAHPLLAPEGLVVVQRDKKERWEREQLATLALARERAYGNTIFELYQVPERPLSR